GTGAAGLVGLLQDSLIVDSYAHGNASANTWSGGIAGSSSNSIIRRSYAYGSVSANTGNRGSLLGWDVGGNTVAAVFVHSQANEPYVAPTPSSPELNLLVTELTTEQFKQSGHFVS